MLLFERGEYVTVTVNEDGNFTVPDESFTEPIIDPETGDKLTLNVTISITGTITNKMLYIREVYSGDGLLEVGGVKYPSSLAGTVAYNGTKK